MVTRAEQSVFLWAGKKHLKRVRMQMEFGDCTRRSQSMQHKKGGYDTESHSYAWMCTYRPLSINPSIHCFYHLCSDSIGTGALSQPTADKRQGDALWPILLSLPRHTKRKTRSRHHGVTFRQSCLNALLNHDDTHQNTLSKQILQLESITTKQTGHHEVICCQTLE